MNDADPNTIGGGARGHKLMAMLRRRALAGGVLLVIIAALAAAYASASPRKYAGEAVLVVPSAAAGIEPPGNPDGADKLAKTLATLIPSDNAILTAAGQRAGLTATQVANNLTVTNDAGTAVIRLDYVGSTAVSTVTVLNSLASALAGTNPPGPIDAGSLRIAKLPQSVTLSGHSASTALPLGLAVGLVVAILAAIALERATPRIDGPAELGDLTGQPVTTWQSLTPSGVSALVSRWTTMVGLPHPDVALVGVGAARRDVLVRVADQVESLATSGRARSLVRGADVQESTGQSERGSALTLRIADMTDRESSPDDIARVADMAVLVVPEGTKAAAVVATMRRLENYGVTPGWAVMLDRSDMHGAHADVRGARA